MVFNTLSAKFVTEIQEMTNEWGFMKDTRTRKKSRYVRVCGPPCNNEGRPALFFIGQDEHASAYVAAAMHEMETKLLSLVNQIMGVQNLVLEESINYQPTDRLYQPTDRLWLWI
jgi:hypothetical protein